MKIGAGLLTCASLNTATNFKMSDQQALKISDVVGRSRQVGLFTRLLQQYESISARLQDSRMKSTILAPSNAELTKLPHKPWENAGDYEARGTFVFSNDATSEIRAQHNSNEFVARHVVPHSPWIAGQKTRTLAGTTIWYEETDGKKIIKPDDIEVTEITDQVGNGQIWVIQGTLKGA